MFGLTCFLFFLATMIIFYFLKKTFDIVTDITSNLNVNYVMFNAKIIDEAVNKSNQVKNQFQAIENSS